jgi:hypothetical protein
MTFLVSHFDTISCSIEFHFQILHRRHLSILHSRLIDSIKVFFTLSLVLFSFEFDMKWNITRHYSICLREGWEKMEFATPFYQEIWYTLIIPAIHNFQFNIRWTLAFELTLFLAPDIVFHLFVFDFVFLSVCWFGFTTKKSWAWNIFKMCTHRKIWELTNEM